MPEPRDVSRREIGGQDPIDRRLGLPRQPTAVVWLLSLFKTRSILGMTPSLTPAIIFLPLGVLLGPRALGVIPVAMVPALDLSVTIALAVIGVLVGMALGREVQSAALFFLAASLESLVTIVAVAAASAYFVSRTGIPIDVPIVALAVALGLSASASSATSADPDSEEAAAVATRVADLDDVLPIVMAMVALLFVSETHDRSDWVIVASSPVVGVAIGAIGWLLFERAESGAERVVYVLGVLALAGGAASFLRVSPLGVGLVAGLTWTLAPGRADRIVQDDLRRVQHPVVVLLLVTAGVLWVPSMAALWLLAPYVLFRLCGKVVGASLSAPLLDIGAADLAAYLMSPGVLALALALNFRQILPEATGEVLLSTVAMGTAAFELFALAVVPQWRPGAHA